MIVKKEGNKIVYIIFGIAIAAIAAALIYSYFYTPKCADLNCLKAELWKCEKASFLNTGENSTWFYSIKGFSDDKCKVYVKVIFC